MKRAPTVLEAMSAAIDLHREHQRALAAPLDEPPDAVPHYLLNKRAPSQPKEPPMASFSDLIASAHALMSKRAPSSDDLEVALDCLNRADAIVEKARRTTITHEDDYPNGFASPSDPSTDAPDGDEEYADEFDEDEEDGGVKKASEHFHMHGYGSTPSPVTPASYGRGPDLKTDTYQTDVTPATRAATPHAFDSLVERVMERDGCSRNQAMVTARHENPKAYQEYQASVADSPTNAQHSRRAGRGVGKRMPDTFEDMVSDEMLTKGVSWRTAETRIINQYGSTAFNNNNRMIKRQGNSVEDEFRKRADQILWDTPNIDRTEALRRVRKRSPGLYKAMNSV
jgi:hypothetical protein